MTNNLASLTGQSPTTAASLPTQSTKLKNNATVRQQQRPECRLASTSSEEKPQPTPHTSYKVLILHALKNLYAFKNTKKD